MTGEIYSEEKEIDALYQTVALGLDVEVFLSQDPVGRLLMAKVSDALMTARTALEKVSPSDKAAIEQLQAEAGTARNVLNWLGEAVIAAQQARIQLEQRENESDD